MHRLIIILGKLVSSISTSLGFGAGATWPGEVALILFPDILKAIAPQLSQGIILVAGTNGKTTTSLMIKTILEAQGYSVIHNASGANLENGIVSSLIASSDWIGHIRADWGVFEVDENALPGVIFNFQFSIFNKDKKLVIVLLNLFRDQLDRYGEVDVIIEKWEKALESLERMKRTNTTLILNADDPGVAHLGRGQGRRIMYYGLNDPKEFLKTAEHATDSTFCLNCGGRLTYEGIYYSHIGIWKCTKCGQKRPKPDVDAWPSPLPGLYNQYNTLAAVATARATGVADKKIKQALTGFAPAFGRQEEFEVENKKVKLFLSKNPAGFNASIRTVLEMKPSTLLLILNDRIPDGRDVSWIWDVDFEVLSHDELKIFVSGDRAYDLGLRLKYADVSCTGVYGDLREAIGKALGFVTSSETLYVLATYTGMLELRKILGGRKIP